MQKLLRSRIHHVGGHLKRWRRHLLIGFGLLVGFIILRSTSLLDIADFMTWDSDPHRGAVPMPKDAFGPGVEKVVYLDQGWKAYDSLWFYNITQGSDLVPYDFFLMLEQEKSQELFRSEANMNYYRYLPQKKTNRNPDALPVGMVQDTYRGKKYMGLTCAACHCSQINYKGMGIRIDGGPAAADMDGFMNGMARALAATALDPAKQKRFVAAVLKAGHYRKEDEVVKDLVTYLLRLQAYNYFNESVIANGPGLDSYSPVTYGYARLDAFGRIYNRVLEHILNPDEIKQQLGTALSESESVYVKKELKPAMDDQDRETLLARILATLPPSQKEILRKRFFNSPNAPVSYPFLWDITRHDYVQWNGVAPNAGPGPIGRNAGEVIGVFGTLDWVDKNGWTISSVLGGQGFHSHHISFESSVKVHNLRLIEDKLGDLQSPTWGDAEKMAGLPPLKWDRVERGERLFDQYCVGCHAVIDRSSPTRRIVAEMIKLDSIGTDRAMAKNSVSYTGYSGILRNLYSSTSVGGVLLDTKAPAVALLTKATENVVATPDPDKWLFTRGADWAIDLIDASLSNVIKPSVKAGDYNPDTTATPFASVQAYKGRSLNGIWATAPFLHNGSVPTLYDLLLPASPEPGDAPDMKYRPKTFLVGSRELDPVKVGFESEGSDGYQGFLFDTSLPANSNKGHEYGTRPRDGMKALNEDERLDLVEYMKSLGTKPPEEAPPAAQAKP